MFKTRHQTTGQSNYTEAANKSFGNATKFKCLGTTVTNQRCMDNYGNANYHADRNLLSSSLQPQYVKIKIYTTCILPIVLYECEIWSRTLQEEHSLRDLRTVRERDVVTGQSRKMHNKELHNERCKSEDLETDGRIISE
jgi:hypothetical protein